MFFLLLLIGVLVSTAHASRPSRFLGFTCSSRYRSSQWISSAQDEAIRTYYNAQDLEGECGGGYDPLADVTVELDECTLSEDTTMYRGCELETLCFVGDFDNSVPRMARQWQKYADGKLAAAIHGFQDAGCDGHNTEAFKRATADACCAQVIYETLNEELCPESAWNTEELEHTMYPASIGFAALAYEDDASTDVDYNDLVVEMRSVTTVAPGIAPERPLSEIVFLEPRARGSKRLEQFLFVFGDNVLQPALFNQSSLLLNPAGDFNASKSSCYDAPNAQGVGSVVQPRIVGLQTATYSLYTPGTAGVSSGTLNTSTVILYAETLTPLPVNQVPPVLGPNDQFTNTIQRANYQESQADYVLQLFYDLNAPPLNETLVPGAPGASTYPGYRFVLRDLELCRDYDLIEVDLTAVDDVYGLPLGVVASRTNCPYRWPLEGRPMDTLVLGGPRCVGGDGAGASCNPALDECPFGVCDQDAFSCYGSNGTVPALGLQDPFIAPCDAVTECPYGFCYDAHGAYPDFSVWYELCLDDDGPLESTICQTNPFDLLGVDADDILYVRP